MTELVEGLTKSEAGEVEEVRVDAGDVVKTANEAEVVGDLVQVFEVLQNLQRTAEDYNTVNSGSNSSSSQCFQSFTGLYLPVCKYRPISLAATIPQL